MEEVPLVLGFGHLLPKRHREIDVELLVEGERAWEPLSLSLSLSIYIYIYTHNHTPRAPIGTGRRPTAAPSWDVSPKKSDSMPGNLVRYREFIYYTRTSCNTTMSLYPQRVGNRCYSGRWWVRGGMVATSEGVSDRTSRKFHVYIYIYIYIHLCVYIYIYICTCSCSASPKPTFSISYFSKIQPSNSFVGATFPFCKQEWWDIAMHCIAMHCTTIWRVRSRLEPPPGVHSEMR